MVWTPKPGVPPVFNQREAFLTLITGDAQWSWLDDFLAWVPSDYMITADFCAAGVPTFVNADVGSLFTSFNPTPIGLALLLASKAEFMESAARTRIFQAYCQNVIPTENGWGPTICLDTGPLAPWGVVFKRTGILIPDGATQMKFVSWTPYGSNYGGNLWYMGTAPIGVETHTNFYTSNLWDLESSSTSRVFDMQGGSGELTLDSNAGVTGHFCFKFNAGAVEEYTADELAAPEGFIGPPAVEASLEGLAAELRRHEQKLDFVSSLAQYLIRFPDAIAPPRAELVDQVVAAATDEGEEDIPEGSKGIAVTVSGVPAYLSVRSDNPLAYVELGWLTLKTPFGNYTPQRIVNALTIVAPLPPYVSGYAIKVAPPMQFVVNPLKDPPHV